MSSAQSNAARPMQYMWFTLAAAASASSLKEYARIVCFSLSITDGTGGMSLCCFVLDTEIGTIKTVFCWRIRTRRVHNSLYYLVEESTHDCIEWFAVIHGNFPVKFLQVAQVFQEKSRRKVKTNSGWKILQLHQLFMLPRRGKESDFLHTPKVCWILISQHRKQSMNSPFTQPDVSKTKKG